MRDQMIILVFAVLIFATPAYPQSASDSPKLCDLSGEWELVAKESESRTRVKYVGGRLTISVKGDEVGIFRQLDDTVGFTERRLILFADGRGETNSWKSMDGERDIKKETKTKWKKRTLTSIWNYKAEFGWAETEESYELSKDVTFLVYKVVPTMVRGGRPFSSGWVERLVFKRV